MSRRISSVRKTAARKSEASPPERSKTWNEIFEGWEKRYLNERNQTVSSEDSFEAMQSLVNIMNEFVVQSSGNDIDEELKTQISFLPGLVSDMKADSDCVRSEIDQLRSKRDQRRSDIDQRRLEIDQLRSKIDQKRLENDQLRSELDQRLAEKNELRSKKTNCARKNPQLKHRNAERTKK